MCPTCKSRAEDVRNHMSDLRYAAKKVAGRNPKEQDKADVLAAKVQVAEAKRLRREHLATCDYAAAA